MEKRKPHYELSTIKAMLKEGRVRTTVSALTGAAALGLGYKQMLYAVSKLMSEDFYKSMTSYTNSKEWQDVYRTGTKAGKIYIKLIVMNDVLILSFKEL